MEKTLEQKVNKRTFLKIALAGVGTLFVVSGGYQVKQWYDFCNADFINGYSNLYSMRSELIEEIVRDSLTNKHIRSFEMSLDLDRSDLKDIQHTVEGAQGSDKEALIKAMMGIKFRVNISFNTISGNIYYGFENNPFGNPFLIYADIHKKERTELKGVHAGLVRDVILEGSLRMPDLKKGGTSTHSGFKKNNVYWPSSLLSDLWKSILNKDIRYGERTDLTYLKKIERNYGVKLFD